MKAISSLATIAGAAILIGNACLYTVQPGECALVKNNLYGGLGDRVYKQGLMFYVPIVQEIINYDCRLKPFDISSETGTRDLQKVDISIRVLQRPITERLPWIHLQMGKQYEVKIFSSIGNEVLRTVVAQCRVLTRRLGPAAQEQGADLAGDQEEPHPEGQHLRHHSRGRLHHAALILQRVRLRHRAEGRPAATGRAPEVRGLQGLAAEAGADHRIRGLGGRGPADKQRGAEVRDCPDRGEEAGGEQVHRGSAGQKQPHNVRAADGGYAVQPEGLKTSSQNFGIGIRHRCSSVLIMSRKWPRRSFRLLFPKLYDSIFVFSPGFALAARAVSGCSGTIPLPPSQLKSQVAISVRLFTSQVQSIQFSVDRFLANRFSLPIEYFGPGRERFTKPDFQAGGSTKYAPGPTSLPVSHMGARGSDPFITRLKPKEQEGGSAVQGRLPMSYWGPGVVLTKLFLGLGLAMTSFAEEARRYLSEALMSRVSCSGVSSQKWQRGLISILQVSSRLMYFQAGADLQQKQSLRLPSSKKAAGPPPSLPAVSIWAISSQWQILGEAARWPLQKEKAGLEGFSEQNISPKPERQRVEAISTSFWQVNFSLAGFTCSYFIIGSHIVQLLDPPRQVLPRARLDLALLRLLEPACSLQVQHDQQAVQLVAQVGLHLQVLVFAQGVHLVHQSFVERVESQVLLRHLFQLLQLLVVRLGQLLLYVSAGNSSLLILALELLYLRVVGSPELGEFCLAHLSVHPLFEPLWPRVLEREQTLLALEDEPAVDQVAGEQPIRVDLVHKLPVGADVGYQHVHQIDPSKNLLPQAGLGLALLLPFGVARLRLDDLVLRIVKSPRGLLFRSLCGFAFRYLFSNLLLLQNVGQLYADRRIALREISGDLELRLLRLQSVIFIARDVSLTGSLLGLRLCLRL